MIRRVGVLSGLLVAALLATQASASVTWPGDGQWNIVLRDGVNYTDVTNDIVNVTAAGNPSPAEMNIVGDLANPAGYSFQDADNIFFRMRVAADPTDNRGGFANLVWQVYLNTDNDPASNIDWVLQLDVKTDNQVELAATTPGLLNPTDWYDQDNDQIPNPHSVAESISMYARAEAVNAFFGSTTFGGSANWFVDIAFPLAKFNQTTGLTTGITGVPIFFATSANHNNTNKDAPDTVTTVIPEPSSLALGLLGVCGAGVLGWRNRRGRQGNA